MHMSYVRITFFLAEKIEFWLTSISAFSHFEENTGKIVVPPIIIVGSKLDQVDAVSIRITRNIIYTYLYYTTKSNLFKRSLNITYQ